jgi:hypothetical protein
MSPNLAAQLVVVEEAEAEDEGPSSLKGMKVTLIGSEKMLEAALVALLVAELEQPGPEADPELG